MFHVKHEQDMVLKPQNMFHVKHYDPNILGNNNVKHRKRYCVKQIWMKITLYHAIIHDNGEKRR